LYLKFWASKISDDYFVKSGFEVEEGRRDEKEGWKEEDGSSRERKSKALQVGPQVSVGRRFSCPYFISASKGKILDSRAFTGQDGSSPIEVGDFLWYCTQQPNEDEKTIMARKHNSEEKQKSDQVN
jgi:hypothetical protein